MIVKYKNILKYLWALYFKNSYSQEGEDLILSRIFEQKDNIFYVDIGAHHPYRFSNTFSFYKRGYRGINVDAMPGSMKIFNKLRNRDINLEYAVSNASREKTYFVFNDPALNTFDSDLASSRISKTHFIINKININTVKLEYILDNCLPKNQEISFLSIDVEGLDFEVLQSNNWRKYRPLCIIVEIGDLFDINKCVNSDINNFLSKINYTFFAKTVNSAFFLDNNYLEDLTV